MTSAPKPERKKGVSLAFTGKGRLHGRSPLARRFLDDLFREHEAMVRAIVQSRLSQSDLEDMVQEVFLKAFDKIEQLQQAESFSAWIRRITHHLCVDKLRRAKQKMQSLDLLDLELEDPRSSKPQGFATSDPRWDSLQKALVQLPVSQRTALHLCYFEGYSIDQAAEELGTTRAGLRQRLNRGRRQLRLELVS